MFSDLDPPDGGWSQNPMLTVFEFKTAFWYLVNEQVAGACGNGHVIFAHVIEKRLEWRDYEASVTGNVIIAIDQGSDSWGSSLNIGSVYQMN